MNLYEKYKVFYKFKKTRITNRVCKFAIIGVIYSCYKYLFKLEEFGYKSAVFLGTLSIITILVCAITYVGIYRNMKKLKTEEYVLKEDKIYYMTKYLKDPKTGKPIKTKDGMIFVVLEDFEEPIKVKNDRSFHENDKMLLVIDPFRDKYEQIIDFFDVEDFLVKRKDLKNNKEDDN